MTHVESREYWVRGFVHRACGSCSLPSEIVTNHYVATECCQCGGMIPAGAPISYFHGVGKKCVVVAPAAEPAEIE